MVYLITFMEGVITFISPCLLPMLPVYILYFTGDNDQHDRSTILYRALSFVLGFTVVFTILGAFAGTIGVYLRVYQNYVNIITGLIVVIFCLNFLGVLNLKLFKPGEHKFDQNGRLSIFKAFIFGTIFALGWTPCVGAFLGSALLLASHQGSTLQGMLMLLLYSIGLGIPFVLSAVLIDRLKNTLDFIKKNYKVINMISGLLLILMGILMMTGIMSRLLALLSF